MEKINHSAAALLVDSCVFVSLALIHEDDEVVKVSPYSLRAGSDEV